MDRPYILTGLAVAFSYLSFGNPPKSLLIRRWSRAVDELLDGVLHSSPYMHVQKVHFLLITPTLLIKLITSYYQICVGECKSLFSDLV